MFIKNKTTKILFLLLFTFLVSLFFVREVFAQPVQCDPDQRYDHTTGTCVDINPSKGGGGGGGVSKSASLDDVDPLGGASFPQLAANILKWIRGISISLAILMFIVGGFMYMTSAGSNRIQIANNIMTGTAIGIVIIFIASSLIIEVLLAIGADPSEAQAILGNQRPLITTVQNVTSVLAGFIGGIGILMILVSGILYITGAGNDSRVKTAKNMLTYAVAGIVVALLSYSIVLFIKQTIT